MAGHAVINETTEFVAIFNVLKGDDRTSQIIRIECPAGYKFDILSGHTLHARFTDIDNNELSSKSKILIHRADPMGYMTLVASMLYGDIRPDMYRDRLRFKEYISIEEGDYLSISVINSDINICKDNVHFSLDCNFERLRPKNIEQKEDNEKHTITFTVIVDNYGRLTIPKQIRDAEDIDKGDVVEMSIRKLESLKKG